MTELTSTKVNRNVIFLVIVASLGYFVDIYDLLVFSIVRTPRLLEIGVKVENVKAIGITIINWQMFGLLIGGFEILAATAEAKASSLQHWKLRSEIFAQRL